METAASSAAFTLAAHGQWAVRLEACNAAGCGPGITQMVATAPAIPENLALSVAAGELGVSATWDATAGASSYRLRWRPIDGNFAPGDQVDTTATSATLTVADYGQWAVRLEACNDAGCGRGTSAMVGIAQVSSLTPRNLVVSNGPEALSRTATWEAAADATSYLLRWRLAGSDFEAGNEAVVTGTEATFTVSHAGEWVVRLEGCNEGGCGEEVALRFTVDPAPEPSPQPATLGYRGQLAEVMVELSLRRPKQAGGSASGAGARSTANQDAQVRQDSPQTASVVYVIDDSGSMDGHFREVWTALEAVRDEDMPNTTVALVALGAKSRTLFELTDHSSAPWDTHIRTFGGKLGGCCSSNPFLLGKDLLDSSDADYRKVIFLTDGEDAYSDQMANQLKAAGIVVDTIAFGTRYSDKFPILQKIANDTNGEYRMVPKPSQGTVNNPPVATRTLSDILKDSVVNDTSTLFLFDNSFSLFDRALRLDLAAALGAAWDKSAGESTTGARLGLAGFIGENALINDNSGLWAKYRIHVSIGGDLPSAFLVFNNINLVHTGCTDIDQALSSAYATTSSESATNKRVVLITDGISAVDVQESTLELYKNDSHLTLDVVAWGKNADRVLLKTWAGDASGTFSVALPPGPAPSDLTATAGDGQVTLKWSDPSDSTITKYQYSQRVGYAYWLEWTDMPDSSAGTTTYTVTGLTNGTAYTFELRAVQEHTTAGAAAWTTATPRA